MSSTQLYRYAFDPAPFKPLHTDPWMLVATVEVRPRGVRRMGNLVEELLGAGVELRVMPSLVPLRNAWATTMHISGIRLRNAAGWSAAP